MASRLLMRGWRILLLVRAERKSRFQNPTNDQRIPRRLSDLRAAALTAFGSLQARRIGKALRALEGRDVAGRMVSRHGEDRSGAIWSVRKCGSAGANSRKPTLPLALVDAGAHALRSNAKD